MDEATETWRPVEGYVGLYEVSDLGRVRSLDRVAERANRWGGVSRDRLVGRVLTEKRKLIKGAYSYAFVNLSRDGVVSTHQVHVLVLKAFVGPRPPGAWARHGPAGLMDNRLTNLSWGTPSENAHDRKRDGIDTKVNAIECPWGHKLAPPNLDPSMEKRGFRRCRACALTQLWGNTRDVGPGDPTWLAEAHRRYAEILHFGAPLNYRLATNLRPERARWTSGAPGPWEVSKVTP